jgi:hypothetical protein
MSLAQNGSDAGTGGRGKLVLRHRRNGEMAQGTPGVERAGEEEEEDKKERGVQEYVVAALDLLRINLWAFP